MHVLHMHVTDSEGECRCEGKRGRRTIVTVSQSSRGPEGQGHVLQVLMCLHCRFSPPLPSQLAGNISPQPSPVTAIGIESLLQEVACSLRVLLLQVGRVERCGEVWERV